MKPVSSGHYNEKQYQYIEIIIRYKTCLKFKTAPNRHRNVASQMVFGDRLNYQYIGMRSPSASNIWSLKTGGLSWQKQHIERLL